MITPQSPTPGPAVSTAPEAPLTLNLQQLSDLGSFIREKIPQLNTSYSGELQLDLSIKKSSVQQTLQRKKGFFIVPAEGVFHYFKIGDIHPKGEHLFEIVGKRPPILREGLVVIDKDVFFVTVDDIQRSVIRKSRKLRLKRGTITYDDFLTGNSCVTTSTNPSTKENSGEDSGSTSAKQTGTKPDPKLGEVISNNDIADILKGNVKRGTDKVAKLDESEVIDMAFHQQIRALLSPDHAQTGSGWEEWEITEDIQS